MAKTMNELARKSPLIYIDFCDIQEEIKRPELHASPHIHIWIGHNQYMDICG